ncbi:MAG: tRNA (adenosine(37)-N6)-dimethylallyltransferase MiaA [bacterium]|nr:tRNA (adenosine(37)-N6)-dimethylallyltransferase MiaA [bacterium]
MNKVIAVVGPTCSGKTGVAIELAKQFNGEVVSADSRQLYTGLDIGTGKVTPQEAQGITHHLIDIADPKEQFSVAQFRDMALSIMDDIHARNKLPIIAGGTGQYVDALLYTQTIPDVPPNEALREELRKLTAAELFEKLQKLDPARAANIEPQNPRRLIRALEIIATIGAVPKQQEKEVRFNSLIIGLDVDKKILNTKIHERLIARIKEGMLAEAEKLHHDGLSWDRFEELGLEYRYLKRHLADTITIEEMVAQLESEIKHYAKRQRTWWKHRDDIELFDPNLIQNITLRVKEFLLEI